MSMLKEYVALSKISVLYLYDFLNIILWKNHVSLLLQSFRSPSSDFISANNNACDIHHANIQWTLYMIFIKMIRTSIITM